MKFTNWKGTCANGVNRGPIQVVCPSGAPCYNISISDFAMWTEAGTKEYYKCFNAFGSGGCLKSGTSYTSYATVTQTVTAAP